jgi:hypothetical protein
MWPQLPCLTIEQCEALALEAFQSVSKEPDTEITKAEFDSFCASAPTVRCFMEYWLSPASQALLAAGSKWSDVDFPPNYAAVAPGDGFAAECLILPPESFVCWQRPDETSGSTHVFLHEPLSLPVSARIALGVGALGEGCLRQGQLADRWLLCVLSIAASRPATIEGIFKATGQEDSGRYCIQLWEGGQWTSIFVDNSIPCDPGGVALFASSSEEREIWVQLVEKAFAKVLGSYAALARVPDTAQEDRILHGLRMLTGGHVQKVTLHPPHRVN